MNDQTTLGLLARLGYAARGAVYLLVGGLAIVAAMGKGRAAGSKDALESLFAQPLGSIWVAGIASGLLLFAFWRVLQAVLNADHLNSDWKGIFRRVGYGISAIIYLSLAVTAVSLVSGSSAGSKDAESSTKDWTAEVLAMPLGQMLVGGIGCVLCAIGVGIFIKGLFGNVDQRLMLDSAAKQWVIPLGRLGFAARGIVFGISGTLLIFSALHSIPQEARGLAGTLRVLQAQSYGWAILGAVAVGLLAFGLFQLAVACYRHIDTDEAKIAAHKLKMKVAT
jgi:hypothetical protein